MTESRGLTGPIWTQYEPETTDEKVLRYLRSEEESLMHMPAHRRRSHYRQLEEATRQSVQDRDDYDCGEPASIPQWDESPESNFVALRSAPPRRNTMYPGISLPSEGTGDVYNRGIRPRGMYSTGSPSHLGSTKSIEDLGAFHIEEVQQPSSPVSPGDVRFSWDFSDGGQGQGGTSSLRNSREGLPNSIELSAAPVQAGTIAPADGLLITRVNRSFRSEAGGAESSSPAFKIQYADSVSSSPVKKRMIAGTHTVSSAVACHLSEEKEEEEVEEESYEHLLESREPAPYSAMPRASVESLRNEDTSRGTGKRSVGQGKAPLSKQFTRNCGPGDGVMEALVGQLVKAKDSVACRTMAERVLLFQASALSQQFASLSQESCMSKPDNSGFGLLNMSGAFVERELDLLKCLIRIRTHFPELLPRRGRSNFEQWGTSTSVHCIGDGLGCLGLGLLLTFAWLDPALEVSISSHGTSGEMEKVVQGVSLAGIESFETGKVLDIIQEQEKLKNSKVLILSYVVVEALRNARANDWALFWRDLYSCTHDNVLVIICDQFVEPEDFLPPQYVQSPGWHCALLEGSVGQTDNPESPAYIAWKEKVSHEDVRVV